VERLLNASRTYPLKGSDAAKSPRLIQVPDREWQGWQLRDLKYWERSPKRSTAIRKYSAAKKDAASDE
jgi:hypothetical protein